MEIITRWRASKDLERRELADPETGMSVFKVIPLQLRGSLSSAHLFSPQSRAGLPPFRPRRAAGARFDLP
jgi:hypothetical protein